MNTVIKYYQLSKTMFNLERLVNYRQVIIFIIRALLNLEKVENMDRFFQGNPFRQKVVKTYPFLFGQLTRKLFYRNSTVAERLNLITQTISTMEDKFTGKALEQIYFNGGIRLWSEEYKEKTLAIDFLYRDSERREGLLTLALRLNGNYIYHVNFWIDQSTIYIGAIQGSRDGLGINKELTKHFFGYRPKNLIVFALRNLAQRLLIEKIYAVSNYGFYANNHIRLNRKLKTSLDEFWQEDGGSLCEDRRFFALPLIEHRKSIEEVVSHKRNLYRKRFAVIDALTNSMNAVLIPHLNHCSSDRP